MDYSLEPTSALVGNGGGMDVAMSLLGGLTSVIVLPIFFIMLAFVLYYFTGEKKKAEDFMPKLMSQSVRVFNYIWLFLIALVAYAAVYQIFNFVFGNLIPNGSDFDPEGIELARGIVLLLLMVAFAVGHVFFNRYSARVSKVGATVSAKTFYSFGLVTYSIIFFISAVGLVTNLIDALDSEFVDVSAGAVSSLFASAIFLGIFMYKVLMTLKREGN